MPWALKKSFGQGTARMHSMPTKKTKDADLLLAMATSSCFECLQLHQPLHPWVFSTKNWREHFHWNVRFHEISNINNVVLLIFSLNEFEDLYRHMFTNVNPGFCEIPTIDWGVANKIVITWYKNWYHMVQPRYQAWIYESCSTFPYMLAPM